MRVISQPSDAPDLARFSDYVYYQRSTGDAEPAYIYHAEMGINAEHEDFRGVPIEWLFTPLQLFREGPQKSEAPVAAGHSTCTASKAAGRLYGSGRGATLVVVKMPDWSAASVEQILGTILMDIEAKSREEQSIITISWGSKSPVALPLTENDDTRRTVLVDLAILQRKRVFTVCAAGNAAQELDLDGKPRRVVDTAPAVLFQSAPISGGSGFDEYAFLIAGNCDNYGREHPTSQIEGLTKYTVRKGWSYAPGVDVQCASSFSTTASVRDTGTSFCKIFPGNRPQD